MLSLSERAQLDRERRERQAKRLQELAPQAHTSGDQHALQPAPSSAPAASIKRPQKEDGTPKHQAESSGTSQTWTQGATSTTGSSLKTIGASDRFWDMAVKLSWNDHTRSGCKFHHLFQPSSASSASGLEYALMACFSNDMDFLLASLPCGSGAPPVTMVLNGRDPDAPPAVPSLPPAFSNWTFVQPPRVSKWGGVQHVKLIALVYPDRLRLIISTGNFMRIDWGGVENCAFVQDFRRKPKGSSFDDETPDAEVQLQMLLDSWDLSSHRLFSDLKEFDLSTFGGKSGARIVASVPIAYSVKGWPNVGKQGIGRLSALVDEWGLKPRRGGATLQAQGSSMGQYNRKWTSQFHLVASGISRDLLPLDDATPKGPSKRLEQALRSSPASALPATEAEGRLRSRVGDWSPIKLLFPTVTQTRLNPSGQMAGGTFHVGKCAYETSSPYRQLFHRPLSKRRTDLLMHAKGIVALQPGIELSDTLKGGRRLGSGQPKSVKADVPSSSGTAADSNSRETISLIDSDTEEEEDSPPAKRQRTGPSAGGQGSREQAVVIDDSETEEEDDDLVTTSTSRVEVAKRTEKGKGKDKGKEATGDAERGHAETVRSVNEALAKGKGKARAVEQSTGDKGQAYESDEVVGFVYVGSANFTQAAWGNLSAAKKTGEIQMSGSNWELGVAIPVRYGELMGEKESEAMGLIDAAVMWRTEKAEPYGDGDEAWDYVKHLDRNDPVVAAFLAEE